MSRTVENELLGKFGENSALYLSSAGSCRGRTFSKMTAKHFETIAVCTSKCFENAGGVRLPESEWLSDNRYIAERAAGFAAEAFSGSGHIPVSRCGKIPLVCAAAERLVSCGALTEERIRLYMNGFQKNRPFTEKELSLIFPAFYGALIRRLAKCARRAAEVSSEPADSGSHPECAEALKAVFDSFRTLDAINAERLLTDMSTVEALFSEDRSYSLMDEESRASYRRRLAELAAERGMSEKSAARKILELSVRPDGTLGHIGKNLFDEPLGEKLRKREGTGYIILLTGITLLFSLAAAYAAHSFAVFPITLIPFSEIVKTALDNIAAHTVKSYPLPRMELRGGIPSDARTLAVISCIARSPAEAESLCKKLELYSLANRDAGENLSFGLLLDLPESREQNRKGDGEILSAAGNSINGLNKKYGDRFCLFTRPRTHNEGTQSWCGRERKRGAVEALVKLIRQDGGELSEVSGNVGALADFKYLILLDSDTRLTVGSAKKLVGAMLHPSAHPVIDTRRGIVSSGYGIIAPAISVDLDASNTSALAAILGGQGGLEPYAARRSDIYQDVFGRGSFAGKGIVDIEAYEKCLIGSFPLNTVLSHDLPEGEILRCGFAGDIELTDGFPSSARSWWERLHRWTRGDWQNIVWLTNRRKGENGKTCGSVFDLLSKWKVMDNLRRSLVPPVCLFSILAAAVIGNTASVTAGIIAGEAITFPLFIGAAETVMQAKKGRLYRSRTIGGLGSAVLNTVVSYALLPQTAFVCLSAIFTALFRLFVSRKNMLKWVTAAESEGHGDSPAAFIRRMRFSTAAGTAALFGSPAGIAFGILWILSPLWAWLLSRRKDDEQRLDKNEREMLKSCASEIWRYFSELMTSERGYLPPDNWQQEPMLGAAERTSPTNIGLGVLSVLSAYELSLTERENALSVCRGAADTIDRLEKTHGHLYNWYSLTDLQPMKPRYVSTVDSGNLAACLTAAASLLRRNGADDLADRFIEIRDAMDFAWLYDSERRLFHIGRNENGEAEGYYDLFASEVRLTSYYACARGVTDTRHWRRLSRPMTCSGGRLGLASWNGSVFEYFMPELFLPLYKNSLIWDGLRFCLITQSKTHRPWGMSESAFASADSSGSYRYKAHGAQKLALKRRVSEDCVIAPYASFLSLAMWPKASVKNLCAIESVCGKGKFGFYEALDYTPARVPAGESFAAVKCFMVHHLGMSLTACANAMLDGLIVKSFIADPEMAAFTELLQEKGPVGRRVTTAGNKAPDDPVKEGAERWRRVTLPGDGIRSTLLSNGAYSVLLSSNGRSLSGCGGTALTLFEPADVMKYGVGMFLRSDKAVRSLVPAPYFDADVSYSSGFYPGKAVFYAESSFWACETECFIHHEMTGEVRKMKLTNTGASPRAFELAVYLEPVLSDVQSYISHPAFSKLSVQTSRATHGVTVTRRQGGNLKPCALNVSVSAPFTFDSSRERVIGEMGSVRSAMSSPSACTVGDVLDPCVLLRTSCELLPGETRELVFAISFAENASEAEQASELLLTSDGSRAASYSYMCSRSLGMTERDMDTAAELLFSLVFPSPALIAEKGARAGKSDLWKYGISGDLPTALDTVESEDDLDKAKSAVKAARYLSRMGFPCDLIVLCREKDVYMRSFASELEAFLDKLGDTGGIYILNESDDSLKLKYLAAEAGHGVYNAEKAEGGLLPACERSFAFSEDAFAFETKQSMGVPVWSHVMTNGRLGWLAADAGTFGMWSENARENRLMPWINDPYSRSGAEQLFLERDGRRISLFAAGDEFGCKITYGPGFAVWERVIGPTRTRVTGFIHPEKDVRILIVSVNGGRENDRILYRAAVFPKDNIWSGVRPSVTVGVQSMEYYDSESGQTLTTGFSQMISEAQNGFVCFAPSERTCIQTSCSGDETADAEKAFSETKAYWKELCSKNKYTTPWPELDRYMNFWNMYQILACRIMGRTSLYQSGGAIGFRDQLQDVCSVCDAFPELARRQILEAAVHQYTEGDVMHWWHRGLSGEPDKGVRTRCSDDLLWLAWSAAKYTQITDSTDILAVKTPWLVSGQLRPGEKDRYEKAVYSDEESTLFEHCIRALEAVRLRGTGARGLLKMGGGDWNDGMNLVGADGRGESVWLTFFAAHTAKIFASASERFGKQTEADALFALAEKWGRAADNAWDGEYYLRGTYDSGALLGSSSSHECRIDSIPQSMAVLSGFGSREKCEKALNSALNILCDTENGVIKLFDVPFNGADKPGYISAYLPGVRENGGQYTHAAIWLSMALFEAGRAEEGTRVLLSVLPSDREKEYRLEPYVLAGDIYSNPQNYARGGWSWYTGSAGWFRTAVREKLLPALKKSGVINMP